MFGDRRADCERIEGDGVMRDVGWTSTTPFALISTAYKLAQR